jgi:hypothetical protein
VLVQSTTKSAPPRSSRIDHLSPQCVPIALVLKTLDLAEIDRPHQAARRVNAAEPAPNLPVDDPVVLGGAFPAHAADQSDHGLLGHAQPSTDRL